MSNPQSIAIVGASARAAAFSVLRTERQVVAADLFADADLVQHCKSTRISPYPEGLADWLAATPCDAWMYTGALENHPDLVDRLAELRPLLGNSGDVLRRCRDPLELQRMLCKRGLHFPETRTSCTGLPLDGSWLCKTYRGSSGSGVWELADEASRLLAEQRQAVFQRRVEGQLASAVFVLGENWPRLLGVTAQWVGSRATGAAKFQYAGSAAMPEEIQPEVPKQLETLAQVLVEQFRLRGIVGVDLVLDGRRAWVLEINPRYTASVEIVERMYGTSAIDLHIGACQGIAVRGGGYATSNRADFCERKKSPIHGKAVLYAKQEVTIDKTFFAWAMAQAGCSLQSGLADLPALGSTIPVGRPILTVFASVPQTGGDRFLRQRIAEVEARVYGHSATCG